MNNDLISREALKKDFDCVGFNDYDDYNRALRIIDNAPTVDTTCPNCEVDMRNNKKETTFDDYLKEQLKDPEFRKEWEKLRDEDMQEGGADMRGEEE